MQGHRRYHPYITSVSTCLFFLCTAPQEAMGQPQDVLVFVCHQSVRPQTIAAAGPPAAAAVVLAVAVKCVELLAAKTAGPTAVSSASAGATAHASSDNVPALGPVPGPALHRHANKQTNPPQTSSSRPCSSLSSRRHHVMCVAVEVDAQQPGHYNSPVCACNCDPTLFCIVVGAAGVPTVVSNSCGNPCSGA